MKKALTYKERSLILFKDIGFSLEKENILSTSRMIIEKKLLDLHKISENLQIENDELKKNIVFLEKEISDLKSNLIDIDLKNKKEIDKNETLFIQVLLKCKKTLIKMRYPDLLNSQSVINETINDINKMIKFK